MSDPRRISAIRRLYLAKLEHAPNNIPYEERCEFAKSKLDESLGPIWREEVKNIGLDPTGGEDMEMKLDTFYDRLSSETRKEGYHGDDVPPAPKQEKRPKKKDNIILTLVKLLHGQK